MQATITSFRRGRHRLSPNQMILQVDGVASREAAEKLVGKSVAYDTGKRKLQGAIAAAHGKQGAVRAIFESGMPGQALGAKVVVQ